MTREQSSSPIDAVLLPFINADDEFESQRQLELLLTQSAEPILKKVVKRKLLPSTGSGSAVAVSHQIEDVCAEAVLQLLSRLRELKANPDLRPIENFPGYVAVVAFNTCHEHIRQMYPRRHRLRNRLRYLLTHDKAFALWETTNESVCGLARWKKNTEHEGGRRLRELQDNASEFEKSPLARLDLEGLPLNEFVEAVFETIGSPVELDALVNAIAGWKRIQEDDIEASSRTVEAVTDRRVDTGVAVDVELEQRTYVQRLWDEICLLPPRQRAALLLNLKDGTGRDCIALFPLTGIATPQEIAALLDIPVQQFAEMWNKLPLDDKTVAERLGITRQQVINLRKSARERLARRMKSLEE